MQHPLTALLFYKLDLLEQIMGDDNADNFKDALPTNQQECSTSAKSMQPPDTVAEASRTGWFD
jgi:hypothetical protein